MKDLILRVFVLHCLILTCTNFAVCRTNTDDVFISTTDSNSITVNNDFDEDSFCLEFIIEEDNRAIAGAEVQIKGISESFLTYASGRVIIDNVEVGTYQYSVRMMGYNDVSGEITIRNASIGKVIELTKADHSIAKR